MDVEKQMRVSEARKLMTRFADVERKREHHWTGKTLKTLEAGLGKITPK